MKDIFIILIGSIFFLYLMTNISLYVIFSILIISFIYKYKNKVLPEIKKIIEVEKPDNNDVHYNENILEKLDDLKKYRKYNINDYNNGLKYFHKFMDTIHTLENRNLKHSRQYIENARLYLEKSINSFQYITTSISDRTLINGIKYDDYISTKRVKKLHKTIDDLYKTSFHILFTITNKENEKYMNDPDIYKTNINLNVPKSYNDFDSRDLY